MCRLLSGYFYYGDNRLIELFRSTLLISAQFEKNVTADKAHELQKKLASVKSRPAGKFSLFKPEQLLLKTRNLLSFYVKRITLALDDKNKDYIADEGFKEEVAAYITQNVTDTDLSVERLALEFSQSRRSFYRSIQLETGMTPAEFIREVRLQVARKLINSNSKNSGQKILTLDEITQAAGYKSTAGFKRAYKQRFGSLFD